MLKLQQMPRIWNLPNISPACMKLETWLRMTGIPYEPVIGDSRQGPKQKIPYIVEDDGLVMGDSTLIIEHLRRKHGIDPDAALNPVRRATAHAVRRMLKENFYWVIIYVRWQVPENWPIEREALGRSLEPFIGYAAALDAVDGFRSVMLGQAHGQGMGRHTLAEVEEIGIADMRAVADLLGDGPYFGGAEPVTADATIYANVANIAEVPIANRVRDFVRAEPGLMAHCRRMRARYFAELPPVE
jgi:glutathione S-transferase